MKLGFNARLGLLALAVAATGVFFVWAAHSMWVEARKSEDAAAVRSIRAMESHNQFQTGLRQLEQSALRYEWEGKAVDAETLRTQARSLRGYVESIREDAKDLWDPGALERMEVLLERLEKLDTGPLAYYPAPELLQELEAIMKSADWAAYEHAARMRSMWMEAQQRMRRVSGYFYGLLAFGVFLLGNLAWVVYRGTIHPLRRRLVEAQARMERQEKLAALGNLSAGIAHEIRNPLTAMKARVHVLRKSVRAGSADADDVEVLSGELERLEKIVTDVLMFARPGKGKQEPVDPVAVAAGVEELLAGPFRTRGVELRREVGAAGGGVVLADPGQIKQVLVNLARNAAESIQERGEVILRVRREEGTLPGRRGVSCVVMEVEDDGSGISREVRQRLFDPYFTTKPNGTGLGLITCQRIAAEHGGVLRYRTEEGKGSVFQLVLPAIEEEGAGF